ncbi:MAG: hypothetical protein GY863_13880 [bacterium]|nr:hypothetical protein [bacterium]
MSKDIFNEPLIDLDEEIIVPEGDVVFRIEKYGENGEETLDENSGKLRLPSLVLDCVIADVPENSGLPVGEALPVWFNFSSQKMKARSMAKNSFKALVNAVGMDPERFTRNSLEHMIDRMFTGNVEHNRGETRTFVNVNGYDSYKSNGNGNGRSGIKRKSERQEAGSQEFDEQF